MGTSVAGERFSSLNTSFKLLSIYLSGKRTEEVWIFVVVATVTQINQLKRTQEKEKVKVNDNSPCCDILPKIIARGCQQYTVGLDGPTLHQQHHVKQDAPLSESQQAVQQAAEMG